jgi:hypothetical protein
MNQDNETPSPWAERVLLPLLLAFAAGVMVMDVAHDYRDMQARAAFVATCAQPSERASLRAGRPQTAHYAYSE